MSTELLSPAGSLLAMRTAFAYGADAVYAGQPRYSLRVRNNEFNKLENIEKAIIEAHAGGKKFYIASNISPHNDKVRSYLRDMEPVIAMKPDALIMSDPGLIAMVRERWPEQEVHLSVQANAVNYATVKFWASLGLRRIILSRELSLDEIEEIRNQCPDVELEVFVHGALCIAYSGRCLLSGYMTHRDSNQGACTNSCRWEYNVHDADQNDHGDIIAKDSAASAVQYVDEPVLLQEKSRPGEYMPAYEDEHGTYIMNSKDLRAVQHVERLVNMGIHSLKIEGRTKSPYYVARTAQVYRAAIDAAENGQKFDMDLLNQLNHLANRGYTEGFYRRHVPSEFQNYTESHSTSATQQYVGDCTALIDPQTIAVDVKNRFRVNDTMELMTPNGNLHFTLNAMTNTQGQAIDVAKGSGHQVRIQLPEAIAPDALNHAMLVRHTAT